MIRQLITLCCSMIALLSISQAANAAYNYGAYTPNTYNDEVMRRQEEQFEQQRRMDQRRQEEDNFRRQQEQYELTRKMEQQRRDQEFERQRAQDELNYKMRNTFRGY